jgi:hypothetical protein
MHHLTRLIASSALAFVALAGCGKKINPDAVGLTCDDKTDICPVEIALAPASTTYTNNKVMLAVTVTPSDHAPQHIQLTRNDQPWMTLSAPFTFFWDTASETEGTYNIIASASVGGDVINSNTITVVVDRTAPTVTLHPGNNATNVALSDPIELVFSEAIDPSTVSTSSVTLKDGVGNDLTATSTLSTDMKTLTVTIGKPITNFPVAINGVLNGTVKDPAGNALVSPAAWSWMAPLWVKLPSFLGSSPRLAKDPSGNPFMLYQLPPASASVFPTLALVHYVIGSTWDTTIPAPTTAMANSLALAVDGTGAPIVGWGDPSSSHVTVSRYTASAWVPYTGNADTGLTGQTGVQSIALDAQGNPIVGLSDITEQMSPPGGDVARWMTTAWQLLTPFPQGFANPPFLATDSTGAPTALAGQTLQRLVNQSWLNIPLPPSPQTAEATLAIDSQDRPVLLFSATAGAAFVLTASTYANTWTPFSPAVTNTPQPIQEAHIAIAPGDIPVVAWAQPNGSGQDLLVGRYTPAAGTQPAAWNTTFGSINALGAGTGKAGDAQLFVDSAGRPCVAFDEFSTSTNSTSVYVWKSNL